MAKPKELPSKEYLLSKFYVKDGFIYWAERSMSRGRPLQRAHKRINTFLDDFYYLRVVIDGQTWMLSRIVYQMRYGDLTPDFEVDHIDRNRLNNSYENLRKIDSDTNKRNRKLSIKNTSSATGVKLNKKKHPKPHDHKVSEYWTATWQDINGVQKAKHFSIEKLGFNVAYNLACDYRAERLLDLKNNGFNYTEDHGEPSPSIDIKEYIKLHNLPTRRRIPT